MNLIEELSNAKAQHDSTIEDFQYVYSLPLPKLLHLAQTVHSKNFSQEEIQFCTLLSVKTGGCKEDCSYCPQSARYRTAVKAHALLDLDEVKQAAQAAKESGSTRFCMGAAWRSPSKKGPQFDSVIEAIKMVKSMGLEVCVTLGMLDEEQAASLKNAGVYAYNHNIDTSPEYYPKVITTRTFDDRLQTLKNVRKAGMTVCCGGIVGMGESKIDRLRMLQVLHSMDSHPESVPVNLLMRMDGTPFADLKDLDVFDLVRTIATARIFLPESRVRLSAGRTAMSDEAQALCFTAGANSVFTGEKLLTADNPGIDHDRELLDRLGMRVAQDMYTDHLIANKPSPSVEHSQNI